MKTRYLLLTLAALPAAAADPSMQPGLYDYTVKMEIPGMPFPLPPQNFKHCLTQADVERGTQYQDQQSKDCEVKNLKQSAGKASFDVACKDGTTGSASYAFTSTSMTGKTVMNREGQAMTMNMSAKRSGDCK